MNALMRHVPVELVDRLAKVAGLLGSDQDGERAAAAFRATEIIKSAGITWRQLIEAAGPRHAASERDAEPSAATDWYSQVHACLHRHTALTTWERQFLLSLAAYGQHWTPSPKQAAILAQVYAKAAGR